MATHVEMDVGRKGCCSNPQRIFYRHIHEHVMQYAAFYAYFLQPVSHLLWCCSFHKNCPSQPVSNCFWQAVGCSFLSLHTEHFSEAVNVRDVGGNTNFMCDSYSSNQITFSSVLFFFLAPQTKVSRLEIGVA